MRFKEQHIHPMNTLIHLLLLIYSSPFFSSASSASSSPRQMCLRICLLLLKERWQSRHSRPKIPQWFSSSIKLQLLKKCTEIALYNFVMYDNSLHISRALCGLMRLFSTVFFFCFSVPHTHRSVHIRMYKGQSTFLQSRIFAVLIFFFISKCLLWWMGGISFSRH